MDYSWQHPDWPDFRFDLSALEAELLLFAQHSGRVSGLLEGLPQDLESEAILDLMISEALKSSAIEGEILERQEVISSIRNHLGLNTPRVAVHDRRAEGIGELMVTVRSAFSQPLTEKMLFEWHAMLMKAESRLPIGAWREGGDPMQVISGRIDQPTVHFEAPPAPRVPREMKELIAWFNQTAPDGTEPILHAPLRSGIAHLYFETIHPFEDGNGRIGRALSEKALSQGLGAPALLSLSQAIEENRRDYYDALESAQRSLDITDWLVWFTGMVVRAQLNSEAQISFALRKSRFFERFRDEFKERELKVVRRMLEAGPVGFEGGMNARKYVALTKTSKATATRDLQHLAALGAMRRVGAGRSTRYELILNTPD